MLRGLVERVNKPSPGGKVAERSEVGRLHPQVRPASNRRRRLLASGGMRAETEKLTVSKGLLKRWITVVKQVKVLGFYQQMDFRPHSSSVTTCRRRQLLPGRSVSGAPASEVF